MHDFALSLGFLLASSCFYLRRSRNIAVKRWMLPLTTAAVAALLALMLLEFTAGRAVDYSVMVPLGFSAGMLLQHLLDYCRRCGRARPLPGLVLAQAQPHEGCPGCRDALKVPVQR